MESFTHELRVRYNECDPQGIVFNANYVIYVDVALTALWRARLGGYEEFVGRTGVDLVVAEIALRFRASARFDDVLAITLTPALSSASSLTSEIAIARDGELLVGGSIRHVCVDAAALTKVPAPDALAPVLG